MVPWHSCRPAGRIPPPRCIACFLLQHLLVVTRNHDDHVFLQRDRKQKTQPQIRSKSPDPPRGLTPSTPSGEPPHPAHLNPPILRQAPTSRSPPRRRSNGPGGVQPWNTPTNTVPAARLVSAKQIDDDACPAGGCRNQRCLSVRADHARWGRLAGRSFARLSSRADRWV